MTDEELIENMNDNLAKVLERTLVGNGLHPIQNNAIKEKFHRLIALARIGAAVKPRPIEEAPKDGKQKLFKCRNGEFYLAPDIAPSEPTVAEKTAIYKRSGDWPNAGWYTLCFYDLSALPTPKAEG